MGGLTYEMIQDAMARVDDDQPDGAYWAEVHDILGVDYGAIFPILAEHQGDDDNNGVPS